MGVLRKVLLEAYTSILHGLEGLMKERGLQQSQARQYVLQVFAFIDRIVLATDLPIDHETTRAIYEIYTDIATLFGNVIRDIIESSQTPQYLKNGLTQLPQEQFRDVADMFNIAQKQLGLL
mmetsp:Transcript_5251/g.3970  ORF Transcript_5251/g.3970 Transcript_5251/m.3970 type:complete len:121 (-) Transcript_5251:29-391(-)